MLPMSIQTFKFRLHADTCQKASRYNYQLSHMLQGISECHILHKHGRDLHEGQLATTPLSGAIPTEEF